MDVAEIERMSSLETEHWWYRGLRNMLGRTLRMPCFQLPAGSKVLDAGCGTGSNMQFLKDELNPAYLGGFDISSRAVNLCKERVGGNADIYLSDLKNPEIHATDLDLVLSCDAISIAGVAQSKAGLTRIIRSLRYGGLFILNVPAFRWLFSSHDAVISTQDRMNARQVCDLMVDLGLGVELVTYRVFSLFPAIIAARLPSILRGPRPDRASSDLKPAYSWVNGSLSRFLYAENWAIAKGMIFPWGSSVYAVGRKYTA